LRAAILAVIVFVAVATAVCFSWVRVSLWRSVTSATPTPKVDIAGTLTHDFGAMPTQQQGRHAWKIKNAGRGDLELWLAKKPGCSCTVTSLQDGKREVVKPGESFSIGFDWTLKSGVMDYHQSATIGTNDPQSPTVILSVRGVASFPVAASPQEINLAPIFNEETSRSVISVFSSDRSDLKIIKIATSRPDFITAAVATLPPKDRDKLKAKAGYLVNVDIKPGLPLGRFSEVMVIHTNHPDLPELHVSIVGTTTGAIRVTPTSVRVIVNDTKIAHPLVIALLVQDGRPTNFEVTHKPAKAKVTVAPVSDPSTAQKRYHLTVTLPPGWPVDPIQDQIVLKTDHPKVASVTIPVTIMPPGSTVKSLHDSGFVTK